MFKKNLVIKIAVILALVLSVSMAGRRRDYSGDNQDEPVTRSKIYPRAKQGEPITGDDSDKVEEGEQKPRSYKMREPPAPPQESRYKRRDEQQEQPPAEEEEPTQPAPGEKAKGTSDVVILSLALNYADLWREGASLEEVSEDERDDTIQEVLFEIGNKMKRRYKTVALTTFTVKKVSQNLALVHYPQLKDQSEIELNLLANQLLQLGGSVINVNIFVNNKPITIVDLGMGASGQQYHEEEHPQAHQGIVEGGPPPTQPPAHTHDPNYEHHEHDEARHYSYLNEIDSALKELGHSLELYDQDLQKVHEDNDKMVAQYHESMQALEKKYTEAKEAVDKEYIPKFQEGEKQYQENVKGIQEAYDAIMYNRQDAEVEYYKLLEEQEHMQQTGPRSGEL